MKILFKWYVILLIVICGQLGFSSCGAHKYHRYSNLLKHRKSAIVHRYRSAAHKKINKKAIPINRNYIIKNKPNTSGVILGGKRRK